LVKFLHPTNPFHFSRPRQSTAPPAPFSNTAHYGTHTAQFRSTSRTHVRVEQRWRPRCERAFMRASSHSCVMRKIEAQPCLVSIPAASTILRSELPDVSSERRMVPLRSLGEGGPGNPQFRTKDGSSSRSDNFTQCPAFLKAFSIQTSPPRPNLRPQAAGLHLRIFLERFWKFCRRKSYGSSSPHPSPHPMGREWPKLGEGLALGPAATAFRDMP